MGIAKKIKVENLYKKFDQLDGSHPLKKIIPDGFVDYSARSRKGGKLTYFNFQLAKKMGLLPTSHEEILTEELTDKVLDTFSIQIINEYDIENKINLPKDEVKPGKYMATRYLQLQHDSKTGKTSGDGRSVWNGQVKHRGQSWDLSSCGTGGTCLSPATSKYDKFFKTGDPFISYGCGYAELDEGLATAILSKIFHVNNHSTEECLGIIEFKNNISINIRAHRNLIRPSHIFLHLKQDDLQSLSSLVDYYIERQREQKDWQDCPKGKGKYDYLLKKFMGNFAKLSADLEDEYIFCWMDWDGDNILMDGGIIDYGSIRQFGIYHYEYRYDDVERFSTNIMEQKGKAKYMVQAFIQAIDYIKSGSKKPLTQFNSHQVIIDFEKEYETYKNINMLHRIGLSTRKIKQLLKRKENLVLEFRKVFSYFEQAKSHRGLVRISDGVTCDAIFSMRTLLREYPQVYSQLDGNIEEKDFIEMIRSQFADKKDLKINSYRKQKIIDFQRLYFQIMTTTSNLFQESIEKTFLSVIQRSNIVNKPDRITGDAVTYIVDLIIKNKKKLSVETLNALIETLVISQNLDPDKKNIYTSHYPKLLLEKINQIIKETREGI